MNKNRACLIFIATILLYFNLNNISLGAEASCEKSFYPDYSYEFVGKDTCEKFNRKVFNFNLKINKYIIKPINIVWASIMPQYGIDRVESFYTNIKFPIRLVGSLLQKDFKSSKTETKRFLTNSTLGIAGLYDVAQSRYKLEPRSEDVEQALAYHNFKKGPYLVIPIVAQGNVRDIVGQVLDLPLNPTAYVVGPVSLISTGLSLINSTTTMQPIYKMADGYADPYEVSKQLFGIDKYIKNTNLDRTDVFNAKVTEENKNAQNEVKISNITENIGLKADINLQNYNPQGPEIDALRSMLFDCQNLNKSKWAELSVWNKNFSKKIKTSSVNIDQTRPNYKYRYILQTDKKAPLAILYPSIGEGIMSGQSVVFAKILYDEGYSVVLQGSPFQWEFPKSMPKDYAPGLPPQDAKYLRLVTSKILKDLEFKKKCKFEKKILVGTSFGGLTTLFVAAQEETDNTLGISNYIAINPPIEIFFALNKLDKYCQSWQNSSSDIKLRAAITAKKIVQVAQTDYHKDSPDAIISLPLTEDESKLAISYVTKLKLSNLVFTLENGSKNKNDSLYQTINNMSFYDYGQKYLVSTQDKSIEQLTYDSSLYSLGDFLAKNKTYTIYHTIDDCFVNKQQLRWLKTQSNDKSIYFSNGSHLGSLYRKEFIDEFKKKIKLINTTQNQGI